MKIERTWCIPNKNTFGIKPIKELLTNEVDTSKLWIDPFANRSKLASITNDLNPEYDTNYHLDALDFLKMLMIIAWTEYCMTRHIHQGRLASLTNTSVTT